MAICDICSQEMTTASSCTTSVLHLDGREVAAFPHGKDPGWGRARGPCGDCGVEAGGFHHLGCDIQVCPLCRGQLISCDCEWEEMGGHLDDDELDPIWSDDDDGDVLELVPRQVRTASVGLSAVRPFTPFGAAVAPLRARHHSTLSQIAEWTIAHGRACDLDVAALCWEVLEKAHGSGGVLLHRDDVTLLMSYRLSNAATVITTALPDGWIQDLWAVLACLHEIGRLDPQGDPLGALLEPLRCLGGLDAAGKPLPEGVDVDFPCQCYLPHDPSCPSGLAQHIVGRDRDTGRAFVGYIHMRLRGDDPPLSSFHPLFALARQLREADGLFAVHPDEFTYVGRVDPAGDIPALWLYIHEPTSHRGFEDLALDGRGRPWIPKSDRRRKSGFRWVPSSEVPALGRCGALHTSYRRPA